ncbi:MAG: 50S ribosomal protein L6 [Firmicutes bacterium]|nr:50S ribosomal protein L6 [Bacillota bacterium]
MSRLGRLPVAIPAGVQISVDGNVVKVKGPKGELSRQLHESMKVTVNDGSILVERPSDEKIHKSLHGLTRALISNMITGVTKGYDKSLELVGVGYRASKSGKKIVITVGFSHPVEIDPPEGIEFDVPNPTLIVVRGRDKEAVGQMAASIRDVRPPEPYQGKGIRYAGEKVRRKAGKAGKK